MSQQRHVRTGYSDLSLESLSVAENLLVTSVRLWKQMQICRKSCQEDWRGGLTSVGLVGIADAVVEPLMLIVHGDGRIVDIGGLDCDRVSETECNFLHCIALLQHQHVAETENFLQAILRGPAVRTAMSLARRFANRLRLASLELPLRSGERTDPSRQGLVH